MSIYGLLFKISYTILGRVKAKITSFCPYSAVQPSFDINYTSSLGYIRKLAFGSPLGNCFTLGKYQTYTDTALSGYQFTSWSRWPLEIYFLCPEKFTFRTWTRDHLICSWKWYHRTNTPQIQMSRESKFPSMSQKQYNISH